MTDTAADLKNYQHASDRGRGGVVMRSDMGTELRE